MVTILRIRILEYISPSKLLYIHLAKLCIFACKFVQTDLIVTRGNLGLTTLCLHDTYHVVLCLAIQGSNQITLN